MDPRRPRVALHISPRLFRDALARALDPHVEVVIAPDTVEFGEWARGHGPFDAIVLSGVARLVDVDAELVVEIPVAHSATVQQAHDDAHTIRTIGELLELLPAPV